MKTLVFRTRSHGRALAALFSAAGILLAASPSAAANLSWDQTGGGALGGTGAWDTTTGNWWDGASDVPWSVNTISGDTAVFGGTAGTATLGTNINALGLTFNTTGYTIAGSTFTLALGSGGINAGGLASGTVTISGGGTTGVSLGAAQTWTVGSGATLAVSSAVGGAGTLTKAGAGTLTLSGANTYGGGTVLNAGTLLIQGSSTPTSGTVTSGPLGTGSLTLNGGTFGFVAGASYTVANNVSVTGATNIQVATGTNEVLNGNWSGSGNLTLVANGSTGQWQFGGDNSGYTGTFTQNNGNTSLAFNNAAAGSAGAAWIFNNATNQRTRLNFGTGTVNFGSMAGNGSIANVFASGMSTVSVGALNTNTTFSGVLGGSTGGQGQNIALLKVGTGTLTLSGANTFTGGTTISTGTLALGSATTLQSATGSVTVNGGTLSSTVASTTVGGNLILSGGSLTANGSGAGTFVLAANKNFSMTSGTFTYSLNDAVSGSGTGTFTITGGTFDLGNSITDYSVAYSVFTGFSSGTVSGLTFINYDTNYIASLGTNGQLTFSAIPEPATYAAIFGLLSLAGVMWDRRRSGGRG